MADAKQSTKFWKRISKRAWIVIVIVAVVLVSSFIYLTVASDDDANEAAKASQKKTINNLEIDNKEDLKSANKVLDQTVTENTDAQEELKSKVKN
jgi:flagellar biosynthesis/type III secretory pathway M-ring protein FliF/YscJ